MRRPDLVHVDLQLREAPAEHAGRAGVVEVDVGQQQRARVGRPELVEQRLDAGRGARVDDQAAHLVGADDPVSSQVHDVYGTGQSDPTIQFPE